MICPYSKQDNPHVHILSDRVESGIPVADLVRQDHAQRIGRAREVHAPRIAQVLRHHDTPDIIRHTHACWNFVRIAGKDHGWGENGHVRVVDVAHGFFELGHVEFRDHRVGVRDRDHELFQRHVGSRSEMSVGKADRPVDWMGEGVTANSQSAATEAPPHGLSIAGLTIGAFASSLARQARRMNADNEISEPGPELVVQGRRLGLVALFRGLHREDQDVVCARVAVRR